MAVRDKVRGSMIGGAIGDALGYQIEFERGVKPKQATRLESGIISDDTQMTLFTACGILWRETRHTLRGIATKPSEAVYLSYLDWLNTQQRAPKHMAVSWIRDLPELNVLRDPGMTCIDALSSGKAGTLDEPINNSKGCGGVMRVAPIGLYLITPGQIAAETCALTHGHPLAILSAFVLAEVISNLANSNDTVLEATKKAIKTMENWKIEKIVRVDEKDYRKSKFKEVHPWPEEQKEIKTLLIKAVDLASSKEDDQTAIKKLGEGWVAEEAVAIALFSAIRHNDSFEDAVVCAVNHDGDSDSTGAITGNIVGAKLGYNKIPDYYKDEVELKDVILELADDLATGVPIDTNGDVTDEKWLKKYQTRAR
ncbi:ADP-ribosylglycohydrolase family protein [Candidatus Saccharibacteria bacterium]|nr:ADP-ribosylglycohydrolase family protein [Candidatus Saccharibacteria bacterium]